MKEDDMMKINAHIEEYRQQIEQHRQAIIALNGAIQALERLQKEASDGDGKNSDTD